MTFNATRTGTSAQIPVGKRVKRALFLAGPALGHITRLLSIAKRMRETVAIEICFAVPDKTKFLSLITENGFEATALNIQGHCKTSQLAAYSSELEDYLSSREFDLIVQDLNPIAWTATVV